MLQFSALLANVLQLPLPTVGKYYTAKQAETFCLSVAVAATIYFVIVVHMWTIQGGELILDPATTL